MNDASFTATRYEPPAEPKDGIREKKPAPAALDVLDVGDDDQPIPPRQWLLGNAFCREYASGLIAPGAGARIERARPVKPSRYLPLGSQSRHFR